MLTPTEQFLISKEKRLFKGFEDYNDITRLVFDLETTSLEPRDGRIFMIGIKTNKGYRKVIECSNVDEERKGIVEFFKIIDEIKPSIISGYNSANFDWYWIYERCKILNPEVLDFQINPESENFTATTDSMLVIENRALGYRLRPILETFRLTKDSIIYAIYPRYEELISQDESELKQWRESRLKTYKGSTKAT